jgi:hypothetical protein
MGSNFRGGCRGPILDGMGRFLGWLRAGGAGGILFGIIALILWQAYASQVLRLFRRWWTLCQRFFTAWRNLTRRGRDERQVVIRALVRKKIKVIFLRRLVYLRLWGSCWDSIECLDIVTKFRFLHIVATLLLNE